MIISSKKKMNNGKISLKEIDKTPKNLWERIKNLFK